MIKAKFDTGGFRSCGIPTQFSTVESLQRAVDLFGMPATAIVEGKKISLTPGAFERKTEEYPAVKRKRETDGKCE